MAKQTPARKDGISGKFVVIALVAVTTVSLMIGVPTTLRFAAAQDTLDLARQSWPKAYEELLNEYHGIKTTLSGRVSGSDDYKSLFENIAAFEKAVLYTEQLPIAIEIEATLRQISQQEDTVFERADPGEGLSSYLDKEADLAKTKQGLIGLITYSLLRLPALPELRTSLAK